MKRRIEHRLRLVVFLATSLLVAMLAGCSKPTARQAPDVQLSLLDGTKPMLSDYRGKTVLGTFWSVSCAVCAEEIPHLNELYAKRGKYNLEVIGFNMPYDRPDWTVSFVKSRSMLYPVSFDLKGEIARGFGGIQATPTTVLIDKQGRVVWKRLGRTDFKVLERELAELAKAT